MVTQQELVDALTEDGYASLPLARGIVASWRGESELDPGVNERNPVVRGSRGGYGLYQLTGPRRRQYEAFASENGYALNDWKAQVAFHKWETANTEQKAWAAVQGAQSAEEAAIAYTNQFLRPGIPHMDKRRRYARELDGLLADSFSPRDPTPTGARAHLPAAEERRLRLADIDPNENHTGVDLSGQQSAQAPVFASEHARQAVGSNTPTLFEGAELAIQQEWISSAVLAQNGRPEFARNSDFQFTEELWKDTTQDIPESLHYLLQDSRSEAHARWLADDIRSTLAEDQKLASLGWQGIGLRFGAALLDPVAVGVSVSTEGLAAPLMYGSKLSRFQRFLRAGTAAGAVNAGIEGYLVSQSPTRDWQEVVMAAGAGFVLGGSFGALRRSPLDDAMVPAVERHMDSVISDMEAQPVRTPSGSPDGSVGAKMVERDPELSDAQWLYNRFSGEAKSATPFHLPRLGRTGIAGRSEHPLIRALSRRLGQETVGLEDGGVVPIAATELRFRTSATHEASFYREYNSAFDDWLRRSGATLTERHGPTARLAFNDLIAGAIRRPEDTATDPAVARMVAFWRPKMEELRRFGQDHNVPGYNQIEPNPAYLPRQHRIHALDDAMDAYGKGNIIRLYAESIARQSEKWAAKSAGREALDYEDATVIAEAYLKSIRSKRWDDFDVNQAFSGADEAVLREMLQDVALEEDTIRRIVDRLKPSRDSDEKGRIGQAKRRLDLDELHQLKLINRHTGQQDVVSIESMLNNDIESLYKRYVARVSGEAAIQDALVDFRVPDIEGSTPVHVPSIQQLKAAIIETAPKGIDEGQMRRDMKRLEELWKIAKGIPLHESSTADLWAGRAMDLNYARVGGQMGIAQLPEIGNIVGQGGVRALLQHLPEMKAMVANARSGKLDHEFLAETEAFIASGTDYLRFSPNMRADEINGRLFEGSTDSVSKGRRLDAGLQKTTQLTSVVSGMAHVNTALQRFASVVLQQRVLNEVMEGARKLSSGRKAALGISDGDWDAITAQMKKYATFRTGHSGKIRKMNYDRWDDIDARNVWQNALYRWTSKAIQHNDPGNMPMFMSTVWGRLLMQFRSFMMASYEKQLLSGLHHRDWDFFSGLMTSMFLAGSVYIGQTQINAMGRGDRERYLDQRLSPQKIAAAAFARSSVASLVPPAVDLFLGVAAQDPIFDVRTSGQSSNPLELASNPTSSLIEGAFYGARGVVGSAVNSDYQFSQKDYRAIQGLIPLQNALGVRNMLQAIGADLPRFSQ